MYLSKIFVVVLYLHSTSNHNSCALMMWSKMLYYIFILHQTTTVHHEWLHSKGCIISSFYIKPQLITPANCLQPVVLYLHSTSNHNCTRFANALKNVVLYLHSTSNHNNRGFTDNFTSLYYIFILHQTTTGPKM